MTTAATHDHPNGPPPAIPDIDVGPLRRVALIAAVAGLAAFAVLGAVNLSMNHDHGLRDFFLTYLCGWVFWACIPFGSMALMMIGYLTSASWGVIFRRLFQAATRTLPVVALLFVPVAASLFVADGEQSPFWWADHSWHEAHEPEEQHEREEFAAARQKNLDRGWDEGTAAIAAAKGLPPEAVEEAHHKQHGYAAVPVITGLNPGYFIARFVIVFGVFGGLIYLLNTWGARAETTEDAAAKNKLKGLSGPGIIAWALLLTMGLTDWVMSVEPTWASSMFPVVFGMNAFICTFSVCILCMYGLNVARPEVMSILKDKFRIDIGSLLLGFTMVWSYATFCQYMLIWAGNLPEELTYFRKRGEAGWQYLAYFLMAFHWLFPFVILLFREVKLDPAAMRRVAVLLLTVCAADVVWWIVPAVAHPEGGMHVPMGFAAIVGVGGLWGLYFARELGRRPILPANSETAFLASWGHHPSHEDTPAGVH